MKFVLMIELGNDAMQTAGDIVRMLQRTETCLREGGYRRVAQIGDSGALHDVNGNRVGGWHVED